MNISILSNLFNKSGGPTGTDGCSDNEELRDGVCQPRQNSFSSTKGGLYSPQFNAQGGSYFSGASVHKGALYAHKARHKIR